MIQADKKNFSTIRLLAGTNFLSSFNPAFFCTFTALLVFHDTTVFEKLAMSILFTFALFAMPLLFTGIPEHYLTTRYSCRNVVTFSRFFECITAIMAAALLALPGKKSTVLYFLPVLLQGIEYAMYRPALKCYMAEMVPRHLLSRASALTEATTFFGIAAGASCAAWIYHVQTIFGGPVFYAGFLSAILALYALILGTRLRPDPALKHNLRFSELPRRWLDSLRHQPRYRELVLTGKVWVR